MKVYIVWSGSRSRASIVNPAALACCDAGAPDALITFANCPELFGTVQDLIDKTEEIQRAHLHDDGIGPTRG